MMLTGMWGWLDGKKTTAGTACLVVSAAVDQVVMGIWQVDSVTLGNLGSTLDWVGMALGGVGLAHKARKFAVERKAAAAAREG